MNDKAAKLLADSHAASPGNVLASSFTDRFWNRKMRSEDLKQEE
jgi:hypothetical protein